MVIWNVSRSPVSWSNKSWLAERWHQPILIPITLPADVKVMPELVMKTIKCTCSKSRPCSSHRCSCVIALPSYSMFCACGEDEGKVSKSWHWRLSWKMHPLFTKFISNLKYAVSCCITSKENLKKWYCRHFWELLLKTYFSGIMLVATLKKSLV